MKSSSLSRRRRLIYSAILIVIVPFACGELLVRYLGVHDADGAFVFFGRTVRPYQLPQASVRARLAEYFARPDSYIAADDHLGWTIRPAARSEDGLYAANSVGIRSPVEHPLEKPSGTLRVALVGDSFTHGDEIPFTDTWGHFLDQRLAGKNAEVINFAVPGYGVDQALRRWEMMGHNYDPDIVVLGLCLETVARCVNVFRPLYLRQTGIPFSKPRYVLTSGSLQLVNSPVIAPHELDSVLADFASSRLAAYEYHYSVADYRQTWWRHSKFLCVAEAAVGTDSANGPPELYDATGDPCRLLYALLREFKQQVTGQGAKFVIVYLPWMSDLIALEQGQFGTYEAILKEVSRIADTVRPERQMLQSGIGPGLFVSIHYSGRANQIVADAVARQLDQ